MIHEGAQGGAEPVDEFLIGASDEVPEPVGLESQPEPFNRVEVRRVARQIHRLEVMPVQSRGFVPRSVVQDEELRTPACLGTVSAR